MAQETIDKNSVRNPSTGIYARNPTRLDVTEDAESQQEIANAIKGIGQTIGIAQYDYSTMHKSDPLPLAGVLHLREMELEQLQAYFKTVMRYRPNIIKIHIKLGEYENKRKINNSRTSLLNANKQRYATDIANIVADIFDDHASNVVELVYTVNNTDPAYFSTSVEAYGVSQEDYNNDELFAPALGMKYIEVN